MKNKSNNTLDGYLYDYNLIDEFFITIDKNKIESNGYNYSKYAVNVRELDYLKYCLVVYSIGSKTVLTVLENGKYLHSQFLIISDEIIDNLKIEDLTQYVDFVVAELVINFFE